MTTTTGTWQRALRRALPPLALAIGLGIASTLSANHPVLVEGEQDYDGDNLRGMLEDADGADNVFGTLTAALGAAGANQNGRVVVVTSGRFQEALTITGVNGNVTLEAAPGVEANIDAVLGGSAANGEAQTKPGIIVDAPSNRRITLRNLVIRNWTDGVRAMGASHLVIDDCRIENNIAYGINVLAAAKVLVTDTEVTATGFRVSPVASTTPDPGIGIRIRNNSRATVADSKISGSFAAGVSDDSSGPLKLVRTTLFDNNPNVSGPVSTIDSPTVD